MSSKVNQALNVKQSQVYDDQLDLADSQLNGGNCEVDFNMLRTAIRTVHGGPAWDKPPTGITLKAVAETSAIAKKITFYWSNFASVTVPATKNWVLLGLGETPVENIAIASDVVGAVVPLLPGQSGLIHHVTVSPNYGNILQVREAGTNFQLLTSSGEPILGLLQVDNTSIDGDPFSVFGPNSAQISFVYVDPSTEVITAVPVIDIENKVIEYAYQRRENFAELPENFANAITSFSKITATATIIVNEAENIFTPTFNGQTIFTLSQAPALGSFPDIYINGIRGNRGTDFNISGTTLTWIPVDYALGITDNVVARFII